ncbi:MAG: DNA primase, partial [Vampirovibrionales bacterium]|nr:DNA primase [Vampirovibrionales bacterium]
MSGQLGRRVSFSQAAALVKAQLDIVEAVSRHVTLKRQGRNHWGVCPFHKEKTPSFSVAADKGLFKCFGCGEAGDAISFLMKIERKSYPELIREAADALGLEVEEREPLSDQDGINRSLLLALNAAALDYFQQSLQSPLAEEAKALLQNRQFSEVFWQEAQLGYAPNAWQGLMQFIQRSGEFSHVQHLPKALVEAGLLIEKTDEATGNTRYFDRFRHRIMIPIADAQNRVVAFGARAIAAAEDPNGMPKYINSPETRLYQKSNVLFGFSWARAAIAEQKSAVVMEGYFDVLTAHRQGIAACVASCGTALTEQQAKLLQRAGAETIYLAFDSDQAGYQAALNAIQRLDALVGQYQASGARLALKILRMPPQTGAKDPDDLLRHAPSPEEAQTLWESVLESAQDAVRFKCDHALQGLSFGENGVNAADAMQMRLEAAHRLVPILANLPNRIMQAEYIGFYAKYCGLDEASLMSDVAQHANASPRKPLEQFSEKRLQKLDAQMVVSSSAQTSKKYPATFATNSPL